MHTALTNEHTHIKQLALELTMLLEALIYRKTVCEGASPVRWQTSMKLAGFTVRKPASGVKSASYVNQLQQRCWSQTQHEILAKTKTCWDRAGVKCYLTFQWSIPYYTTVFFYAQSIRARRWIWKRIDGILIKSDGCTLMADSNQCRWLAEIKAVKMDMSACIE